MFTALRSRRAFFFCFSSVACLSFAFSWPSLSTRRRPRYWRARCSHLCDFDRDRIAASRTAALDSIACIADRDNRSAAASRRSICRGRSNWWSIGCRVGCCRRRRSTVSICRFLRICPDSRYRHVPRRSANLRLTLIVPLRLTLNV